MGRSAERGGPQKGLRAVRTGLREFPFGVERQAHQARAEIARAVRRVCRPSARRGPPSERVKNPRSEGSRPPIARSVQTLSKRYTPKLYTGHGPDAPPPPQPPPVFPVGDMHSCVSPSGPATSGDTPQGHVPDPTPRPGALRARRRRSSAPGLAGGGRRTASSWISTAACRRR
jgi:hypothetical protein